MNKVGRLFWKNAMDAARSVVSINDVILNCSCGDMEVGASYVNGLHKTRTTK